LVSTTSPIFMSRLGSLLKKGNMAHGVSESNPRGISGKNTLVNDLVRITRNAPDEVSAWKRLHAFLEDGIFSEAPIDYDVVYCHKGRVVCQRVVSVLPGQTKKEAVSFTLHTISFEYGIDVNELQFVIETKQQKEVA
jgi:hypothetical protein